MGQGAKMTVNQWLNLNLSFSTVKDKTCQSVRTNVLSVIITWTKKSQVFPHLPNIKAKLELALLSVQFQCPIYYFN